jgi:hypothetical protein
MRGIEVERAPQRHRRDVEQEDRHAGDSGLQHRGVGHIAAFAHVHARHKAVSSTMKHLAFKATHGHSEAARNAITSRSMNRTQSSLLNGTATAKTTNIAATKLPRTRAGQLRSSGGRCTRSLSTATAQVPGTTSCAASAAESTTTPKRTCAGPTAASEASRTRSCSTPVRSCSSSSNSKGGR